MKFTLAWLKEHLDTDAPVERVTDALTRVGLEVESVTDKARELAPFVTARVLEAKPHPNADRLRVCQVDPGTGAIQVVCGAPNARTGMIGVFATAGTFIPGTGLELKAGTIRGEASNGMLVSEREMGLSDEHAGIIELPESTPIGVPFATILGLGDPVIEIGVTPNRPDCLGVGGIARDLAAAEIGDLKERRPQSVPGRFPCPVNVTLEFGDTPPLCPAFGLRLIRGVRNGPSPDWLQRRLRAIGLRPINALVDITNFLTYDRNRPLHVFDAAKVAGDLVVRRARAGESLLALDGRTYALDEAICVIADAHGVESLGGIMGGEASGCTEATADVLVESALWDPSNLAQTGRKLGIVSGARYRFERGVDPAFMLPGLELATAMILELCGGEPSEIALAGSIPETDRIIDFPIPEVRRLTGLDLSPAEIRDVLTRLGFWVSGNGATVKVAPPSWRPDIEGKADLVEEVMRIVGIDRVPSMPLPRTGAVAGAVLTPIQKRTRTARRALAASGLVEAVTWSFMPKAHAQAFGGGAAALELANPIAADLSDMRPSLIPGLAAAIGRNAARGFHDLALFEVGQIFKGIRPEDQVTAATAIRSGSAKPGGSGRHWSGPANPVEMFDAKADAFALLAALGFAPGNAQIAAGGAPYLHPGRSGTLKLGNVVLGHFGELHPRTLDLLGLDGPVVAAEILLDRIPAAKAKPTKAKPPLEKSDLQPVTRDFAFLVGERVAAADIVRAAQAADRRLVSRVSVFDLYAGQGVEPGKKSLAIEVTLQPRERTLTDAEIDAVAASIVAAVAKATGAVLRAKNDGDDQSRHAAGCSSQTKSLLFSKCLRAAQSRLALNFHREQMAETLPTSLSARSSRDQIALDCGLRPTTCVARDVGGMLRKAGLRPTRQRIALGRLLYATHDRHVTAEMLHEEAMLARVPVSLATVYNTLHQFTEAGLLRELAVDGSKTYFDTNVTDHHHFIVDGENLLMDIPDDRIGVGNLPEPPEGMEIARVDVVVRLRRKAV